MAYITEKNNIITAGESLSLQYYTDHDPLIHTPTATVNDATVYYRNCLYGIQHYNNLYYAPIKIDIEIIVSSLDLCT